jgi:pimeloyl-ACP methyl ester carboxylesterase
VSCPFCGSGDVETVSPWGGQIITRQCRCRACNSYFEAIRDEFGADRPHLTVAGRRLEYTELPGAGPALVLLHEGLGSVGLWRSFPDELAERTGRRVVAFSRFGHGDSDAPPRPRTPAFMHEEAREVLPAVLAQLGIERPVLVGHSDGASIALIHAAEHATDRVVAIAPHVFVEPVGLAEIRVARDRYADGLRERMARHHRDPDAAFHGWNDVWLDPAFADWSIEDLLPQVAVPVLLVQGEHDQYGTMEQLDRIERAVAGPVQRLHVAAQHAPHLEAPEATLDAIAAFVRPAGGPAPPRAA